MKDAIISRIEKEKIIAIVRGVGRDKLIPFCEAIVEGGIHLLEVAYPSDGSRNHQVAEEIRMLAERFGDALFLGAGTVLTPEQVRLTKAAGGGFIISPNTDDSVITATVQAGMVSIPGALTPTEIARADQLGADFVKVFPASVLGPAYIKAVRSPLSHIKLMAVGGINADNMADYMKCGVCGFGIGSDLTKKELLDAGNYAEITRLARRYVDAARGGGA